jgi:cell division protein FtsA
VLTGGTSELKGMADYVQNVLGGSARTARPSGVVSLPSANVNPAFSTAVGLVLYAADPPADIRPVGRDHPQVDGPQSWWRRMAAMWNRGK